MVEHQKRRDLRGLFVFAAWLNHTDTKSINSLDSVVEEGGVRFVKHFLIDFGAILGSDSFEAKSPRAGQRLPVRFQAGGVAVPLARAVRAGMDARGLSAHSGGGPPGVRDVRPGELAQQLSESGVRSAHAGRHLLGGEEGDGVQRRGDSRDRGNRRNIAIARAAQWITKCLIERRNKIGRAFFDDVLPLDDFAVRGGKLAFEDLGGEVRVPRRRESTRSRGRSSTIARTGRRRSPGATSLDVPRARSEYLAADIRAGDPRKTVTVYLRRDKVVGIDRTW